MMNAIEKLHALLVSDRVNVWHFAGKLESPRFFYWSADEPENKEGYAFATLEEMVDAAYARIDPLLKPSPFISPPAPNTNQVRAACGFDPVPWSYALNLNTAPRSTASTMDDTTFDQLAQLNSEWRANAELANPLIEEHQDAVMAANQLAGELARLAVRQNQIRAEVLRLTCPDPVGDAIEAKGATT